ncbi:MAG: hypothetical protein HYV40_05440 [Candidatus Levybacteria bacterium]|nr:hypothetical protein [Candidatus Levybacteria bacterium]
MSLERRIAQMRQEGGAESSPYSLIVGALNRDSNKIWDWYSKGGAVADPNGELAEVYGLSRDDIPNLSLPSNFSFTEGFSLVRQWYVRMKAIAEGLVAPQDEPIMDSELARMFRDRIVTTGSVRDTLSVDPSGATWLSEMARAEFTEGTLALTGARKAIAGVRNMHTAIIAAA